MELTKIIAAIACLSFSAHARLLETEAQSEARYGPARDDVRAKKDKPLMAGAVEKVYWFQEWRIRAAFVGGVCHKIQYSRMLVKGEAVTITDAEIAKILEAEKGTWSWKEETSAGTPGQKAAAAKLMQLFNGKEWIRGDGAKAMTALGLVVEIRSTVARDMEKKAKK